MNGRRWTSVGVKAMAINTLPKIVTWKWNTGKPHPKKKGEFTAEHVNKLYKMIDRHISIDYEPVCITDDPTGIDKRVRIVPLWDDYRHLGGCYTRLKAFSQEMEHVIGGRFLWLDLDAIICGDLAPYIKDPADIKFWGDTHPRTPYNGSIVLMTAGCREDVWTRFQEDTDKKIRQTRSMAYIGTDQAIIGLILGRNERKWSVRDGIYSFRIHFEKCKRTELPDNARIVMFHGRHDPSDVELYTRYPWIKEHWR